MDATFVFILASFALGFMLISQKDKMRPELRRWLALLAIVFILCSFTYVTYTFFTLK